ncbi:MAG: helix-turn-helix domain-containing protein, partial [Pseudodesulfovibrio sp.]|nr:helix-turn-helix domain-containing protein [Pseudodesulfovibrio sp.]
MKTLLRKTSTWIILFGIMVLLAAPVAIAQEDAPTGTEPGVTDTTDTGDVTGEGDVGEETEAPSFENPAQAAKAEALAEAAAEAAAEDNAEAVAAAEAAVSDAQTAVDTAQAALDAAVEAEDAEAEDAAQADLDTALDSLETVQTSADETLANAASVSVDDIASMRAEDMGWGEIAHELGVHPSTIGLGHKTREQAKVSSKGVGQERASVASNAGKATGRNVKSGIASTPGVSGGKGSKGVGLSRASSKAQSGAKGSKSSQSSSASGGRGNSGNSGNGGNSGS